MKHIAVIGSGTMGNGIAHVFAQNEYPVTLVDIDQATLDKALQVISRNLDRQINKELITPAEKDQALQRIATTIDIKSGVSGAELVVEAGRVASPSIRSYAGVVDGERVEIAARRVEPWGSIDC